MSQHVLSVKVENQSGVLARVVNLFSARGYNIDSLSVSKTEDDDISCITVVVNGDDRVIEQVKKQLNKLIDIIKVTDQPKEYSFQREIVMLKLQLSSSKRIEIFQIAQTFKASILDITQKSITLEYLGSPEQLDIFIEILRPYGIKELNRSGRISFPKD
ncbi:MAG TPA: acetolactate synthase small subunit [Spirochaetota bacterium]|nr:acetolactate synthase small subunit [Spirochaetota bacterium]MBP9023991.1 acetolactate synthase small subunit [Spirochaetota bacterium]HOF32838.1 acetolactate synthase small subunit [Spirochaetota bacterium]HOR43705.1 acetolactate synthase small subunit [Spirochaetota bacterium]HOU86035.1 acetolactate synthase small subunit [Spirochaetota bacterium]